MSSRQFGDLPRSETAAQKGSTAYDRSHVESSSNSPSQTTRKIIPIPKHVEGVDVAAEPSSPKPDDTWVAIMGMTGAGKSTFISTLIEEEVSIGHGLHSSESTKINLSIY